MSDCGLERDKASQRKPEDRKLIDPQGLCQTSNIVRQKLRLQRTVDIGRSSMPLKVWNDHFPADGETRRNRVKHLDRSEASMQEDERQAAAPRLEVEPQAVHVRVRSPGSLGCHPVRPIVALASHAAVPHNLTRCREGACLGPNERHDQHLTV
jgi:hypothetical protein